MTNKPNLPSHDVFTIIRREGDKKDHWLKIGAAWPHNDDQGFAIRLEALPLNNEIVLRQPTPENDA